MRATLTALLCLVLLALATGPLLADDDPAPPAPPTADEPPEDVPSEEAAEPGPESPPAETAPEGDAEKGEEPPDAARPLHKIYVPYRELARIFEKEGEGVFLPYAEFLDLWRRAHRVTPPEDGAPVAVTIREASYTGRVEDGVVVLEASLQVDVLEDGWQAVPLDFGAAGIERATLGDEEALLAPGAGGHPVLMLEGRGRRTLDLVLRTAVHREGEASIAVFQLPPVPLSRLTLDVPGSSSYVKVDPPIAHRTEVSGDRTRLVAFLGPVGKLRVFWQTRVEEAPAETPLLFAELEHDVRLAPGVLRAESDVRLSVLRAPLSRLSLAVPEDVVTLYVRGDGLRTWRRSADGRRIDLELREPAKERWAVRIGVERQLPPLPSDVVLPLVGVEGVERETGFVRLLAGEGVKAEAVDVAGLRQVDLSELPEALRGGEGRASAWRYATRPGDVRVRVEALEPRVDVALGQRVILRAEGTQLAALARLEVSRAGIFGVELEVPTDLEVGQVVVGGGAAYDDHRVRDEDGRRVVQVSFRDRLLGTATITVAGRRDTKLAPEDEASTWTSLSVPLLRVVDADHVRGYLEIRVDPGLEHREERREGLVEMDAGTSPAQGPPAAGGTPPPLARRYEYHGGDIALDLSLRRRAPLVKAAVETALRLEPDRMRVSTTLRYDVRYRGVDTFRFTAPLSVADLLRLDLEGVQLLGPEPIEEEGREPTRGTWTLKLPADRMGEIPIPLAVEDVPDKPLESGAPPRRVPVPTFVPVESDGAFLPNVVHHVAIRRDPLLEVGLQSLERVEEIDPRELPPALASEENFLALRAYDPGWAAALVVTRHDYEPVAEVVVSHMHLDTVVQGERGTTEAFLVVLNNDRQNLALDLPAGASIRGLTVDGQNRTPRRDDGRVLVPLPSGLGKDEAFVVAVSYDHDVGLEKTLHFETWRIASPVPENVTADLLTWRVYLPEDLEITAVGGDVRPARPYRSWFSRLVRELFQTFGRRAEARQVDVEKAARGFQSPFAMNYEGTAMLFHNRVGNGTVEITAAPAGSNAVFHLLFFVLAAAGLWAAMAFAARIGLGEGTLFLAAVLVVLVLLVRAGKGDAGILNALLFGFLLAGLARVGRLAFLRARERRDARAVAATDVAAAEAEADGDPSEDGEEEA